MSTVDGLALNVRIARHPLGTVSYQMRAAFPKATERAMARFEWGGRFYAETPIYSRHDRLPHDLAHYAVDAVLRPRYGFWELAARRAPFSNLTPSKPWPKDRVAWFATVLRDHRDEMVEAERVDVPERGVEAGSTT